MQKQYKVDTTNLISETCNSKHMSISFTENQDFANQVLALRVHLCTRLSGLALKTTSAKQAKMNKSVRVIMVLWSD